ncbi:condensation domain-containing protein [Afipia felis]|nr:condensation domain-containing protein [Afipia felis]
MRPTKALQEGGLIRLSQKHPGIAASLATDDTTEPLLNSEPASASQRRTWFMELIAPGVPQHHLPFALEVFGKLDLAALQLSLDFIVERHEALRTLFVDDNGTLRQVIGDLRPKVMLVDAPSGPTPDLKTILREQVAAPFDLSRGPLVRLAVVTRAPGVHILVFVLHHIIADNLSLGLFVREIAQAYTSFDARNLPELTPLPWQYADFAIAEAQWLTTRTFHARLQDYTNKLSTKLAQLDFGTRRAVRSGQMGASNLLPVDAATLDRLREVAQETGVTLFTVLLAALQTVLAPYANGPDFVITVPVAGRGSDGAEGIIGPFANAIALKASAHTAQTIAELVADVGHQLVDALEYENVPWDALVRATNPSRSRDAAPLSQVMFSSVAVPSLFQRFGRLPCRPTWVPSPAPTSDLFVTASETPDGLLWIGFDSRPGKVPPRTVSRISNALRIALDQIAYGNINTIEAYPRRGTSNARSSHDPKAVGVITSPAPRLVRKASTASSEHREALEKVIAELWLQFLGSPPAHMREDFFDAGGDSLMAVRLMSALSRRLDRKLPVALFFENPTANGLVNGLTESRSKNEPDHAVTKITEGSDGRLLFMCSAQRNSIQMAKALGPGPTVYKLDVYNLQEQRLLADLPMFDSIEAIAKEFLSRIRAVQPKGPYLLAGGCEGGIVAFEMALQLQQAGEEIALLGQLDTPVRGFFESKAVLRPVRIVKRSFEVWYRRTFRPNAQGYEWHLRIWGGIWPAVRAYYPGHLFDGNVHLFRAARTFGMADVASNWDSRISGQVVIYDVPGGHHDWMEYSQSAATVRAALDEIVPPASTVARKQLVV